MRITYEFGRVMVGVGWLGLALACHTAHAQEEGYGLNAGDLLQVSVWREDELTREVLVRPDGKISFPLVGEVDVAGRTPEAVRDTMAEQLTQFIPEPVVTVSVKAANGNRVYVLGQVAKPGPLLMAGSLDVMQALASAGGLTTFAASNKIKILRRDAEGMQTSISFRYSDVEDGEQLATNIMLRSGDVIVVP